MEGHFCVLILGALWPLALGCNAGSERSTFNKGLLGLTIHNGAAYRDCFITACG